MAQIVLIDKGTVRMKDGKAINAVGDVVSIHDDDVSLKGSGYDNFKVITVPGTAEEVRQRLNAVVPEVRHAFKATAPAGEFSFDRPEEIEVWDNNGKWCKVEERPKYQINITADAELDSQVADEVLTKESKLSLLANKAIANVTVKESNMVEIAELASKEE